MQIDDPVAGQQAVVIPLCLSRTRGSVVDMRVDEPLWRQGRQGLRIGPEAMPMQRVHKETDVVADLSGEGQHIAHAIEEGVAGL